MKLDGLYPIKSLSLVSLLAFAKPSTYPPLPLIFWDEIWLKDYYIFTFLKMASKEDFEVDNKDWS